MAVPSCAPVLVLAFLPSAMAAALRAQSAVVGWGAQVCDSRANEEVLTGIAAGRRHVLAIRGDGSLFAWGNNDSGQCNAPALPAGLTYVEVAAGNAHSLARRSDGSVVAWGANYTGPGLSTAVSAFGPLPLDLSTLGMPGCIAYASSDAVTLVIGSNGRARYSLPIPRVTSLVGARFHQQALVFDPGAGNAFGAVLSDAATAVIGW